MFQKWKKDLKRIHDDQLLDLILNREVFRQFAASTARHTGTHQGAELARWMQQGYVAFAGTAIRRLLEQPPTAPNPKPCQKCGFIAPPKASKAGRSVSLVILLRELQQHSHLLSRSWFCCKYKGMAAKMAGRDFDLITRKKGEEFLSADRINRDIAKLEAVAKPIRRLVNKAIAHTERDRRRIGKPKHRHIDLAIDEILKTFRRYRLLLEQKGSNPSDVCRFVRVSEDLARLWP